MPRLRLGRVAVLAIVLALGGAACDRVVDLTAQPDGGNGFVPDGAVGDDGGVIGDGGIGDGGNGDGGIGDGGIGDGGLDGGGVLPDALTAD